MKIVFFGTPEFASTVLVKMVKKGYDVVGVVTTPDRRSGRGHKLQPSDVKMTAQRLLPEVPILQPDKLRDEGFLNELEGLGADLFVVVAFRMLPVEVWTMPERGTFNLHASLLPKYRGAAPIQHVILNGESVTGVTTFFLDEEIDTGRILLQREVPIRDDETGGTLHDRLMEVGADLVCETVDLIKSSDPEDFIGTNQRKLIRPEDLPLPTAPKIFKQDRELHFTRVSAVEILRRVRAMCPYPACIATHQDGTEYKIFEAQAVAGYEQLAPGTILITDQRELIVGTTDGAVELLLIQAPSKRPIPAKDFLMGNSLEGSFI